MSRRKASPPLPPPPTAAAAAAAAPVDHLIQWYTYFAQRWYLACLLLLSIAIAHFSLPDIIWDWYKDRYAINQYDSCVNNIVTKIPHPIHEIHVPRVELESSLEPFISTASILYCVIVGPRGCGKSSAVVSAAAKHTGIIQVTFSGASQSVYADILQEVCPGLTVKHVSEYFLAELFRVASAEWQRRHGGNGSWVPTVIAEIDKEATDIIVTGVAKAMKRLGSDTESCRAILVLSDAHAAFALPKDDARIQLVWIEDFTMDEAHSYLTQLNFLPLTVEGNKQKRDRIFDLIGTRPARLKQLVTVVKNGVALESFVNTVLDDARDILGRLLFGNHISPSGTELSRLVERLLDSGSLSVPISSLTGVLRTPNRVAPILKEYHALLYHYPSKTYRFYTRAYYHAARELLKNITCQGLVRP